MSDTKMKIVKAMKKASLEGAMKASVDNIKNVTDNIKNVTDELTKVIFARPLRFKKDYIPPSLRKSDGDSSSQQILLNEKDEEFLTSVVTHHADFVLSNLNPKEVQTLIRAMESITYKLGEIVIKQGDVGDYLYVVKEGYVKFFIDDIEVGDCTKQGPGTVVGELALLYDCPRAATVITNTECIFYRVSQDTFRRIQASYVLSNDNETRTLLKNTRLFEDLSYELINELSKYLFQKSFHKNDVLVKKGDTMDEIYFIKDGIIEGKNLSVGTTKYADLQLKAGECFGERSLVLNEPSTGDAVALTDGIVWVLTRERFYHCLKGLDLHQMIEHSLDRKFLAVMPIIAHSDIDRIEIDQMCDTFTHITLQPGDILANVGDQVEPAIYFVKTVNQSTGGYIQLSNKDGVHTKKIGPSEGFGFGGYTLLLSNIDDGSSAAAYGREHGLFSLDSEQAVLKAKHHLINESIVTAQSTATAMGTKPVQLRKLSIHDLRSVIYDELRLGKDYRKNRSYKPDVTKDTLEKKRLLGQGTFGQVWLCKESKSNEPYALKIQYKRELIDQHQADGVIKEKNIMEKMNHPFVMGIVNSQADTSCLYMVMDLIQGGELRNQMRNATRPNLCEKSAKFYAACMLEGLSYMHRRDYIYRDLKGENVMIDRDGYCVIIDLGFAKFVPDKTFTFCGTPIFIAPEVVMNKGHDKSADIWSLGVMIYEMLFGTNPFFDYDDQSVDQRTLFKRIVKGQFQRPRKQSAIEAYMNVSDDAKDLIKKLLVVDVTKRLGCMSRVDLDIRDHPWFSNPDTGIDFGKLYRKEITAPWIPTIESPFDGNNFSVKREQDKSGLRPLNGREQKLFEKFC